MRDTGGVCGGRVARETLAAGSSNIGGAGVLGKSANGDGGSACIRSVCPAETVSTGRGWADVRPEPTGGGPVGTIPAGGGRLIGAATIGGGAPAGNVPIAEYRWGKCGLHPLERGGGGPRLGGDEGAGLLVQG